MMISIAGFLDAIFENLFVVLVLVNLFFRLFVKKAEEEGSVERADSDWFESDSEYTSEDDPESYEDWRGLDDTPSGVPSGYGAPATKSEVGNGELETRIRELIAFAKESFIDDDQRLRELKNSVQQSPGLHKLIPSLAQFHHEVLNAQEAMRGELKRIEGALYERVTLSILSDMQDLLNRVGRRSEETHLLYGLSQAFITHLSDAQLAYRLLIDELGPFTRHRHAEGADLKTYPLPAPPSVGRYQHQLKRYARDRFNWFVTTYRHLDDIGTWPLQARSSGYALSQIASGWSEEWRRWCGGSRKVKLPAKAFRQLHWNTEESLGVWGEQLLSVYIMALRYGPAAARALFIEAQQIDDLDQLAYIGSESKHSRYQTTIAPFMVEMEVVLAALKQMGFQREAEAIAAPWRQLTGGSFKCKVAGGSTITLPLETMTEDVERWCQQLSDQKWSTWNDERLSEIVGLTCTRGMWSLAERHARQLIEGEKLSTLPDHVHWLTVIHIAQSHPEYVAHAWRLTERYLDHHLPLDASEQKRAVVVSGASSDDLIAALVLSDLFERRTFRGRRA